MLRRSQIADVLHLLKSAPVNIDAVARGSDPGAGESLDRATTDLASAERRYRKALAFAHRRRIGKASLRASADQYLLDPINHHARCIMMPHDLVLAAAGTGLGVTGLAAMFEVPLDAVERRLGDWGFL
jgi:hypothetical protein